MQKPQLVELPFLSQSTTEPTQSPVNLPSGPTPTSQPISPLKSKVANLNEPFTMKTGNDVEVADTGLKLKITAIAVPPEGTFDLPNRVEAQATYQGQEENLSFIIGGNQPEEIERQRRAKNVFNLFNIYVQKVTASEVTLIVKRI